jgi:hypothetical protein
MPTDITLTDLFPLSNIIRDFLFLKKISAINLILVP